MPREVGSRSSPLIISLSRSPVLGAGPFSFHGDCAGGESFTHAFEGR